MNGLTVQWGLITPAYDQNIHSLPLIYSSASSYAIICQVFKGDTDSAYWVADKSSNGFTFDTNRGYGNKKQFHFIAFGY